MVNRRIRSVFLFLTPERSCRGHGARCPASQPDARLTEKEVGKMITLTSGWMHDHHRHPGLCLLELRPHFSLAVPDPFARGLVVSDLAEAGILVQEHSDPV